MNEMERKSLLFRLQEHTKNANNPALPTDKQISEQAVADELEYIAKNIFAIDWRRIESAKTSGRIEAYTKYFSSNPSEQKELKYKVKKILTRLNVPC